jgi:phosphohistidine phosphatase SixA
LAQAGEFGFVLLTLGAERGLEVGSVKSVSELVGSGDASRRELLRQLAGGAAGSLVGAWPLVWAAASHAAPATPARPDMPAVSADVVRVLLRRGGVVIAFRHALAPGTFDPPGFRLDDCSTQRNLSEEGREQARRIGQWFRAKGLTPSTVRSSPWCRCLDTAQLAFGHTQPWDALSSPAGEADATQRAQRVATLRQALRGLPSRRFEAWVTHQFVLQDLAGVSTQSGEALVLRPPGRTRL